MSPYLADLRAKVGSRLLLLPAVAAVVRNERGWVLVVDTTEGHTTLPGGFIDPGETPREALIREVREETGLEVQPAALRDALGGPSFRRVYPNGHEVEALVCVFDCVTVGGRLHFDGVETVAGRWVPPEEAVECFSPRFPACVFHSDEG